MIGQSEVFLATMKKIQRIAESDAPVLIEGETGTGKELAARAIHYDGCRRDRPFVPVNCGAVPENLLNNELFGHACGAFTGANTAASGLLRLAHTGTLFLDEIDALTLSGQVALLRFLQDGRFRPLGAAREEVANVRVMAASNRDLNTLVAEGKFREDLLFRLRVLSVVMPPLRDRDGDVQLLTDYFLSECAKKYCTTQRTVSAATRKLFKSYHWPGNVRELENSVHSEFLLSDNYEICPAPQEVRVARLPGASQARTLGPDRLTYAAARHQAIASFERAYLNELLRATNGNVTQAARIAGKERRSLGKLLKKYGISRSSTTDAGAARRV